MHIHTIYSVQNINLFTLYTICDMIITGRRKMNTGSKDDTALYQEIIINRIKSLMHDNGLKQQDLAEKTGTNQSMISKILSGSSTLTLTSIVKICSVLKVSPSVLLSTEDTPLNELFDGDEVYSTGLMSENDNLVFDTSRQVFRGYLNVEYFVYFYSTMSTEDKILNGKLLFKKSDNNKRCETKLELFTGKKDLEGNEITKIYTGEMAISISMSSCYVTLVNYELGELCFFCFRHMFLFNQEMLCRIAEVLTVSSGENKRPTAHRMIISKYKLDTVEDEYFIKGQLKLNGSDIVIEKEKFEILKNLEIVKNSENLSRFFNEIESIKEYTYIKIEENMLRNMSIDVHDKVLGISLLREYTDAPKHNKVGSKPDEYIYKYILPRIININTE